MATLRLFSSLMKGSEMSFDYEPEFQWQEDAACRFQPYTLFEIADKHSPISIGLSGTEIKELNDANFERAQEICNTCPVKGTCLETAEKEDFDWSVRGGLLPIRYNPVPQGRPEGTTRKEEYKTTKTIARGVKCRKGGHDEWQFQGGHRWRCIPCRDAYNAGRPRNPKPEAERFTRGVQCKFGHDDWVYVNKEKTKRRCYICRRDADALQAEKKRDAKLLP